RQGGGRGPGGSVLGMATGGLVGLLGGPVGVAVGAAAGTSSSSLVDLANVGVGADFLDEVVQSLRPGKAAVVAEVEERWVTPWTPAWRTWEARSSGARGATWSMHRSSGILPLFAPRSICWMPS